jgi:hypothetical protein
LVPTILLLAAAAVRADTCALLADGDARGSNYHLATLAFESPGDGFTVNVAYRQEETECPTCSWSVALSVPAGEIVALTASDLDNRDAPTVYLFYSDGTVYRAAGVAEGYWNGQACVNYVCSAPSGWEQVYSFDFDCLWSPMGVDASPDESPDFTKRQALQLGANRPNPFNPTTMITYSLPNPGHVELSVYDTQGRRVATILDREETEGPHLAQWDAKAGNGVSVAPGVYFLRLKAASEIESRKITLVK